MTHKLKCPHPECAKLITIKNDVSAGDYQCVCHACWIRVSWATYLGEGRKPYFTLAEKPKEPGKRRKKG